MFLPANSAPRRRRGLSLATYALLMPVMIGITALSVDLGVKAVAVSQLQTVADASALAGAAQLATNNRLIPNYVPTAEMNSARSQATSFGAKNSVLRQAATVQD